MQIYAQQLFVDGFFNADPHAGNLMVAVQDGRAIPVLLDFGMTVKLTDQERLAYAELAFAAQQMDIQRLQSAVRALGTGVKDLFYLPAKVRASGWFLAQGLVNPLDS